LWRMAIILKDNKVNLFVSSVLFVFWYHSPNLLYTPRIRYTLGLLLYGYIASYSVLDFYSCVCWNIRR
jgi:hypothetical protein